MAGITCCYKCQDRFVTATTRCHSTCKKYLDETKKNQEEKARIYAAKELETNIWKASRFSHYTGITQNGKVYSNATNKVC